MTQAPFDFDADAPVEPDGGRAALRRRWVVIAAVALVLAAALVFTLTRRPTAPGRNVATVFQRLTLARPLSRDTAAYAGLGTWVDVFDYVPAYQTAGHAPAVTPADVDAMAAAGVRTVFIQASRSAADARSPDVLVNRELLAEFIVRAHRDGVRVVGWYLPPFANVAADLARVRAIAEFSVLGHRFDGVAIDIEETTAVPDVAQRNTQLVALSGAARAALGSDALGAVVLPPVQTEVVNPAYWPAFPWSQIKGDYDAWLPMSYWTFRKTDSGYHDGYTYNEESTRRLRADLGNPAAAVDPIGGVGDQLTATELQRFVQSLVATKAIGGSIYDWASLSPENRKVFQTAMAGVKLPPPP